MASVIRQQYNGRIRYRIQYPDGDTRRKIHPPWRRQPEDAEAIATNAEALNGAKISGRPWRSDLAARVANLGDDLAEQAGRTRGARRPASFGDARSFP